MTTSAVRFSKCRFCKRRDVDEGGDGSCPIRSRYAPWSAHVAVHVNGCRSYREGDVKPPPPPELPPLTMFGGHV